MQIIHVSDTHLGCAEFGLREREQDGYDAFNEVVETAVKDRVGAVIHAGDIFHVPRPGGTPLVKLAEGIKSLADHGIRFYFTLGEHDISRVTGTPTPYLFHRLGLATYVGNGEPAILGETMVVGFHKRRVGEMDELVERLRAAERLAREHSGKKVLVLHQGLLEFHRFAGELRAGDLPPSFDYYAMGHLHDNFQRHFEGMKGPVCYPGSLDPTPGEGIREFKKGFYITDLSGEEARPEWVQLSSSRRMLRYELDYDTLAEGVERIAREIASQALQKKPVLSVSVSGRGIDLPKTFAALSRLLPHCLHYVPEINEEGNSGERVYPDRPPDMQKEMLSLAEGALGSRELASFAVEELLPALARGDVEDAVSLVRSAFEKSRFGAGKN